MARPTSLTPGVRKKIVGLIAAGNWEKTAAIAAGVTEQTFHNWMSWGAEGKEPYAEFREEVLEARAGAEVLMLDRLKGDGEKWQRWAWWLERSFPDRWGRRDTMRHEFDPAAVEAYLRELGLDATPEDVSNVTSLAAFKRRAG